MIDRHTDSWLYVTQFVRQNWASVCPLSMTVSVKLPSASVWEQECCSGTSRRPFSSSSSPRCSGSLFISVRVSSAPCFMSRLHPPPPLLLSHVLHTHTFIQTTPGRSCGNRPCPCECGWWVINQASQASSVSAPSDSAAARSSSQHLCMEMCLYQSVSLYMSLNTSIAGFLSSHMWRIFLLFSISN